MIRLLFIAGLIASTAARTLTIEKVLVTLSEDSDATYLDIPKIVDDMLSGRLNLEENELSQFAKCVGAKCCVEVSSYNVCFQASLVSQGVHIVLTVNDKPWITTDITAKSPLEICVKNPPKPITKACLVVKDLDLAKHYGCLDVKVEARGMKKTIEIGCFKLGGSETVHEEGYGTGGVVELPAGSVLKFRPEE